jgi:hypothetical protein
MAPRVLEQAYCPTCNVALGLPSSDLIARSHAQTHSSICGHPTHVVDANTWQVLDTLSGEPALPLWDQ